MAMRREGEIQADLIVTWSEMPRSPGHAFYDKLQALLTDAGFDAFVEEVCKPYYAPRMGAPSVSFDARCNTPADLVSAGSRPQGVLPCAVIRICQMTKENRLVC